VIRATFAGTPLVQAAADVATRRIRGVAVPWNEVGVVADGRKVKFLPGSLDVGARPVVLRDHDRARPIGMVAEADDTPHGLATAVRVSATRDGDEALVLASDGALNMFSVGADPTDFRYEGDVLVVAKADWQELSLLSFGAFTGARVTDVAASEPEPDALPDPEPEPIPAEPEPEPEEEEESMPEPAAPVQASGPVTIPPTVTARPPAAPLTLARLAAVTAAAPQGGVGPAVAAVIQATTTTTGTLTDVITTDVYGIVRPAYLDQIRGLVELGRPLVEAVNKAPLPPAGMRVEWPHWLTLPLVDEQLTQKTPVASGRVEIDTAGTDVKTLAGGNDISIQLAQRSSPSFMEAYFRACAEILARKQNAALHTAIVAKATVVAKGADFAATVMALLEALDPTAMPSGPLFLALSWTEAVKLVGAKLADTPAFWSGSINFGGTMPEVAADGLNVFVDRSLGAGEYILGARNALTWYEDPANPYELRVMDISLLGIDAGVYGFHAIGEDYDATKCFATVAPTP
jgi:HK97 family phage prohead protease